jgi:hypothetical protein
MQSKKGAAKQSDKEPVDVIAVQEEVGVSDDNPFACLADNSS